MPASPYGLTPDPQGGLSVSPGAASTGSSESLVRRPDARTYVGGALIVLAGVAVAVAGIRTDLEADEPMRSIWLGGVAGMALLLICWGLTMVAWRTVFDADGIHSRGLIRRVDLPWPDTRTAFVVDVGRHSRDRGADGRSTRRRREVTLTVHVLTPGRSTTLAMPRILSAPAREEQVLRARLEADLDEIWAWALGRGYVREWNQGGYAPGRSGPGARTSAYAGPPADQGLLAREPLVFRQRPDGRTAACITASIGFMLVGGLMLVRALQAVDELALDDAESIVIVLACVQLGVGAALLIGECLRLRSRLTVSRDGLEWTGARGAQHLAWPPSRTCVFVQSRRISGRTMATVCVLAPDTTALAVPGLTWRSKHDRRALLPAATAAQSIWQWGYARGVARDDGVYRPAADAEVEQRRVATAQRIEYLHAHPQETR
ncbi:hypothetical protein [Actinomyces procaprae]|uniref:hypothetical protein n=1 Tax=Actinomyces procaprae TaxID=2560010 RepID=UPI00109D93F8|nr:hypothetical protein [Actinomyces procaprae]